MPKIIGSSLNIPNDGPYRYLHSNYQLFRQPTVTHLQNNRVGSPYNRSNNNPNRSFNSNNQLSQKLRSVTVNKNDHLQSLAKVQSFTQPAVTHLQNTGNNFGGNVRMSGSCATNTKINKADEFDFDLPMNVKNPYVRTQGKVFYEVVKKQQSSNLNVPMTVTKTERGTKIPYGYAEVRSANGELVVPRKVNEDFHKQLTPFASKREDIHLSKESHGPAITYTMKNKGRHDISVDLTASILTGQITLNDFQWPRSATMKVLPRELINDIYNKGVHLVPKDDTFWYASVSLAEEELMNGIDKKDDGCRKECHKLLKADFLNWQGRYANRLPGLSTNVFKHVMFWMNEKDEGRNWSKWNLVGCYTDMLQYFSETLRSGNLPNYFKPSENILKDKDQGVLYHVANLAARRRHELLN